jgi:GNAT superfamily N-acetyltransferase
MTVQFTLRPAHAHERFDLEALQWRASLANAQDREVLLANPQAIDLPHAQIAAGQVIVADLDGEAAGFAVVLPRPDGDAELDGLFVEPTLWKSGLGRALVQASGEFGRDRGAAILHVVGNPHALGFYEACGFQQAGVQTTQFGQGILLRLPL